MCQLCLVERAWNLIRRWLVAPLTFVPLLSNLWPCCLTEQSWEWQIRLDLHLGPLLGYKFDYFITISLVHSLLNLFFNNRPSTLGILLTRHTQNPLSYDYILLSNHISGSTCQESEEPRLLSGRQSVISAFIPLLDDTGNSWLVYLLGLAKTDIAPCLIVFMI